MSQGLRSAPQHELQRATTDRSKGLLVLSGDGEGTADVVRSLDRSQGFFARREESIVIHRLLLNDTVDICRMLREEHAQLRTELSLAARHSGEVARAARRLAQICLPHFELEEQVVLPIFALLTQAAAGENARPPGLEARLTAFHREQERFQRGHEAIARAAEGLLEAAYKEGNREATELSHMFRNHERIEDDLALAAREFGIMGNSGN